VPGHAPCDLLGFIEAASEATVIKIAVATFWLDDQGAQDS
jgi:hypothetical protein